MKKTKAQILAFFSEKKKVSQDTALAITDALYTKGLDIKSLERVMWRIEDYIRTEKMGAIMDLLTPQEIEQVIDEMIAEDNEWKVKNMPSEDGTKLARANFTAWGFSEFAEGDKKEKKAGDIVDIQIMRTGKWKHPAYGEFEVTPEILKEVKANFDSNARGIELAVDENHEPNHKALAWYKELYQVTEEDLFAKLELTQKGADLLNEGAYRYFSPEIVFYKIDEETGNPITNMLVGGAFTNRPFFKSMQPLMASEEAGKETGAVQDAQGGAGSEYSGNFYIFFEPPMKTLLELLSQFSELVKLSKAQKEQLETAFSELPETSKSPEITKAVNETLAKFSEDAPAEGVTNGTEGKQEEKKVEASEGEVTISASELATLRAQAAKGMEMQKSTLKQFSESSTEAAIAKGNILPKHKDKLLAFSESLGTVDKAKEFFELIGEFKAFNDQENGHGNTNTTAKTVEDEKKFSEKVSFLMNTFGFSEEQANEAVKAAQ